MTQPVNKEWFWRKRLKLAKEQEHLHYSVFLAADSHWERIYNIHKEILLREIKPEEKVLDLGCGYGRMSALFEHYVGVDFSPDLLEEAGQLYPGKTFICANLNKLPFDDKTFDVGFAISMRHMIVANQGERAWNKMEKECKRVCKRVIILEYGISESLHDTPDMIGNYEIL